jgi:GNAT superfamily N-acetyltransferase
MEGTAVLTVRGLDLGKWLAIFLRDDSDSIVAGLYGWTWAGCLKVSDLWVHENERRRGRGSELLEAAENEARARGCFRAVLDTHSFQAPGFYQKRGYSVVSIIEDFPPGHRTYTLFKNL